MNRFYIGLALWLLSGIVAIAQSYDYSDEAVEKRIRRDIGILAGDSLQGREAGTEGEYMARTYIAKQFEEIGLKPMFIPYTYFQDFTYNDVHYYGRNNRMIINGKKLKLYKDYYAISFTGNDSIMGDVVSVGYGLTIPDKGYDDYKDLKDLGGKIFIVYTSLPDQFKKDPNFEKYSGKLDKVKTAISKGAKAVIFIRPNNNEIEPSSNLFSNTELAKIPVVFLRNTEILIKGGNNSVDMNINVVREKTRPAYNVGGRIDNGADSWVVIGAHYDHMGWGTDDNGEPAIFNGADDNASGTAAVIELARYFKNSEFKKNNYLFICFSGEEKGLIGSTYFTNSKILDLAKINYMIDLDMIGKLNDKRALTVFGTGNASQWNHALTKSNAASLKLTLVKSGVGGSDHMPFYYKQIPAIFIHTGLHKDYHTPADDVDKLNYKGETEVISFTRKLIEFLDDKGKLTYKQTTAWQAFWGARKFMKQR
jgi:aminopeptidase YwaD